MSYTCVVIHLSGYLFVLMLRLPLRSTRTFTLFPYTTLFRALHETPTGWKFFCNLLDAGEVTICGEESFGTSSSHAREKDGLWAVLAWANVLAETGKSVREIADAHWARFGRHYFARHDYEELSATHAEAVMQAAAGAMAGLAGQKLADWTVTVDDDFNYREIGRAHV